MASINEKSCSLLVYNDKPSSYNEIKDALEGNDPEAKVLAMKRAVMAILNGEQMPQLFITIVRYVLPSEDHAVQKLLLLYLVRYILLKASIRRERWSHRCEHMPNGSPFHAGSAREDRLQRQAPTGDGEPHMHIRMV